MKIKFKVTAKEWMGEYALIMGSIERKGIEKQSETRQCERLQDRAE